MVFRGICSAMLVLFVMAGTAQAQDYCREFSRDVRIGDRIQPGYGTACMQPDGSWKIKSDDNPRAQLQEGRQTRSGTVYYQQPRTGYYVERPSTRIYSSESYGYGYGTGGSSLYIGSGPAYYPNYGYGRYGQYYYGDRNRYRWGDDYQRDGFYRYHHNPGWEQHWNHHRRALGRR